MPGPSGLDICRDVRSRSAVPIIVLDDYVTKPFSVRELLGRVQAQLRRGEQIGLTRSEFQLLRLLVGHAGEVFPRRKIMEELWQTEFQGDERACDVHISRLSAPRHEDKRFTLLAPTFEIHPASVGAMGSMRESWTDKRLDERFDGIDRRFDAVDQRFDTVDRRFESLERRMDEGFHAVNARIDGLQRTMLQTSGVTIAALIGLIATQL